MRTSQPILGPTIADILNSPMPEGWEKAVTPGSNNEVYFINHISRATSWYDPRLREYKYSQCSRIEGWGHDRVHLISGHDRKSHMKSRKSLTMSIDTDPLVVLHAKL